MSVHAEHTGSEDFPTWIPLGDISGPTAWCTFSCASESLHYSAGKIIVLRMGGELDLCTLPILQAALDSSFGQHPAHLIVDLDQMIFCSAPGLTLLTQTARTAAEKATGYAVSGVPPQIERIWILVWEDLPARYPSTAAAVTAICAG